MCRHLAWFGAPRTLAELILEPDHGLLRQSWQPRLQSHGTINADGWGVGFHPTGPQPTAPVRWRSDRPLWGDASFASVAPHLSSGRVVAAVRSASVGMPLEATAAAPFLHGPWLISHNGTVDRAAIGARLDAESTCDSALLAAHIVAEGVDRMGGILNQIAAADPSARLNLLLLAPDRLVAVAWGDTLYSRVTSDGVLVASEPDDSGGWLVVPDRHLMEVTSDGTATRSLLESCR